MQSEKDVDHMAMPGWPGAMFIMIHPQLAFPFFEALLDGPPHDGGLADLGEGHIGGCIGEGEFGFPIRGGSDEEPHRVPLGQTISGRNRPAGGSPWRGWDPLCLRPG